MFEGVEILVRAGKGGNGAVSFRREKFVPLGGPDGGDGGDGGSVVIVADDGVTTLRHFRQKGLYRAANGRDGGGQRKHGKSGEDLILKVPVGTVVVEKSQVGGKALIADLEQLGERVVVVRGGSGGWGNTHFASSTNQTPRIAKSGEPGEENFIILEMRLIADVGIIGYPNVGKSTLLAAASAARPEIAGYPFTTKEPVLGMVEVGQRSFVLAEIPGLLDGAHLGRGLGHDFLRHIVRTKILIHLIDGGSDSPEEDMARVNAELGMYDSDLAKKPQIVAINKIDLPDVRPRSAEMKDAFGSAGVPALFISAATGEGVPELMSETMRVLQLIPAVDKVAVGRVEKKVFRPHPRGVGPGVRKDGDIYVVEFPELERIIDGADIADYEVRRQIKRQFARMGVSQALKKAGVKPGDRVRCGRLEWEW